MVTHTHTHTHAHTHSHADINTLGEQTQPRCAECEKTPITRKPTGNERKLRLFLVILKKQYWRYQNMKLETFQVSFMHQWSYIESGWGGGGGSTVFVFLYQMANTITVQVHSHKPSDPASFLLETWCSIKNEMVIRTESNCIWPVSYFEMYTRIWNTVWNGNLMPLI